MAAGASGLTAAVKPRRIVDTHVHFYDPSRAQGVPWPNQNDSLLYRTTLPKQFREAASGLGVDGVIVVEASGWLEDNQWLLDLAKGDKLIQGITGNLQAGVPEFAANLKRFARNRLFLGIRLNGRRIAAGLSEPAFVEDMKRLAGANLQLDAIGDPSLIETVARLTDRVPELRVVIDHLPLDKPTALGPLRGRGQVWAKVSGNVRAHRDELESIYAAFGPQRLIYASNWPVSNKYALYPEVLQVVMDYFAAKGQMAADGYFWKNAKQAYRYVER